jgi:dTMP kinase
MFICIDGADASGKHTQSTRLADALDAHLVHFPDYSTPMGHLILGHLKSYWTAKADGDSGAVVTSWSDENVLNALIFQALQLANRMEHATRIQQLLDDGKNVVADRYWPSGWVYGQADGLDAVWLERIHEYLPQPDLYLLLDIAPEQSVERRPERRDRYEQQEGLMDKVVFLYRRLWRQRWETEGKKRWVIINGRDSIDGVARQIIDAVGAVP